GTLVMGVLPAPYRIDLDKVRLVLGTEEVRLARESEFADTFADCERGAEPAVGTIYGVATILDRRLDAESIVFAAGSHSESITLGRDDYMTLVHPKVAEIGEDRPS
ncbi:MAG TPA: YbaK/EbsC family protein, partial [Longimicrobiales bacterium]|nr:YbaK/EbsC family protein [Longimicrobiales bacterium]